MGVGSCSLFLELLFETGRADVSVRGEWQRGMPSAGIALSIKPTVLLCRSLTEHSPCAGAREMLTLTATRERRSWLKKHIPNQATRRRAMEF